MPTMFDLLPEEVLLNVLSFLSVSDQSIVSRVCQRFTTLCADQSLWKDNCLSDFNLSDKDMTDWKSTYKNKRVQQLCDQVIKEAHDPEWEVGNVKFLQTVQLLKRMLGSDENSDCEREIVTQMFHHALDDLTPMPVSNLQGLKYSHYLRLCPQKVLHFTEKNMNSVVVRRPVDPTVRDIIDLQYLVFEYPTNFSKSSSHVYRLIELVSYFDPSRTKVRIQTVFKTHYLTLPRFDVYYAIRQIFDETIRSSES